MTMAKKAFSGEWDGTEYARYRAILRETHARDGMTPFYSVGDGGWCDWTAPEVLFKGEHSLTRTPYGYMPTEAVQEMLRLRSEFDRGGWWTVLAWVAECVRMRDTTERAYHGLKRLEDVANRAIAHGERLKARVAELESVIKRVNQLGGEMRHVERDEDLDHDGTHPLAVVISHLAKALGKECRMD